MEQPVQVLQRLVQHVKRRCIILGVRLPRETLGPFDEHPLGQLPVDPVLDALGDIRRVSRIADQMVRDALPPGDDLVVVEGLLSQLP